MVWDWQNITVVSVAAVFVLYLAWRMRPVLRPRTVRRVVLGVAEARAKARAASTPRGRAEALTQAGDLFASERGGALAAAGHYLRAMRADPAWVEPINRLRSLLWDDRPRMLERILWRRLAAVSWDGDTRGAAAECLRILAELHRTRLRDRIRAQVFSRAHAMFTSDQGANS